MPVLRLECPNCGHQYRSLVLAGTRTPEIWTCSKCGSDAVQPKPPEFAADGCEPEHPWESRDPARGGCPCCGM